jgi:hypothetical protein
MKAVSFQQSAGVHWGQQFDDLPPACYDCALWSTARDKQREAEG